MAKKKSELRFVPLTSLVYLRRNPQYLTPHEMESLKQSIKRDGFLAPVLVRKLKGSKYELLSGNHRAMAAKECGFREIPAIVAPLNDKQAQRVAVNLNTVHGDPTAELLAPFLAELDEDVLRTVHLDDEIRKQVVEIDQNLEAVLSGLQPEIPDAWNKESSKTNIKQCVCPNCGKHHIRGRKAKESSKATRADKAGDPAGATKRVRARKKAA